MREELKRFLGKKIKVYGYFERFGVRYYKQKEIKTLILKHLRDHRGKRLADHLWFDCGKKFDNLNLEKGDQIRFHATVREYWKGYINEDNPFKTQDFKLVYPSKVYKMSKVIIFKDTCIRCNEKYDCRELNELELCPSCYQIYLDTIECAHCTYENNEFLCSHKMRYVKYCHFLNYKNCLFVKQKKEDIQID